MRDFIISIIVPAFNEEKQLYDSIHFIHEYLNKNKINHDFILIDDGSRDGTWNIIRRLSEEIPGICARRFSRNFGKEAALCAGLDYFHGDACIVIDSDLQHPPEIIPEMVRLWNEEGYQVVEGVKSSRGKESLFSKIAARSFYYILKKVSGVDLNNASDFKLLDAGVVSAWKSMPEHNTFFRGMIDWVGFKRTSVPFVVAERKAGGTKWSFWKLFRLAINAITSFSSFPLQIITFTGVLFLAGFVLQGISMLGSVPAGADVKGLYVVVSLQLLTGGLLMIGLGIIGIYLAKIYDEVKGRPRYIVAEEINSRHADAG